MGGACLAALAAGLDVGVSPGADLPVMTAALAALLALSGPSRLHGAERRRVALALGGLVAVTLPAALAAGSPWTAFLGAPGSSLGIFQVVALGLLGCLAALNAEPVVAQARLMLPGLLVAEGALALVQVAAGRVPAGTFSNTTYLGQAMVVSLPFALLWLRERPRWTSWVTGAATLAVLILAESWVAAGVVATVMLLWALRASREAKGASDRRATARIALAVAAAAIVGLVALAAGASLGSRPAMWRGALAVLADSPLLGVGPDGFRVALAPHATVGLLRGEGFRAESFASLPADPHNLVLALLVSFGVVGAVGALVLVGMAIHRTARSPAGLGDFASALAVGGYAATTLLAPAPVQTLPLVLVAAAPLTARLLRVGDGAGSRSGSDPGRFSGALVRAVFAVAAGCALLVALHSGVRLWVGPLDGATEARDAARAQVWADVTGDPFALYVASWRWVATGSLLTDAEAARLALDDISAAVTAEPDNPFYRLDHARTLEILGHPAADVLEEYEAALALFPVWDDAHLELAEYLVFIGRPEEAREHVEFVLEHVPGQRRANEVAAGYFSAIGDDEKAMFYAEQAYGSP